MYFPLPTVAAINGRTCMCILYRAKNHISPGDYTSPLIFNSLSLLYFSRKQISFFYGNEFQIHFHTAAL